MESGYQTFAENFRLCCGQSCDRLAYEAGQADPAYQAESARCDALFRQLEQRLGEERRLLDRFDEVKNGLATQDGLRIYQQGFQDCVYLLRWLGMLAP